MFLDNSSFKFIREAITGNIEGISNLYNEAESLNITYKVIDFQDGMGRSALFWSIQTGNIQAAKLLIELGADVNQSTNNGNNPLIEASSGGHISVVKKLIERGARLDASQKDGKTPFIAAVENGHPLMAEYLFSVQWNITLPEGKFVRVILILYFTVKV